MVRSLRYAVLKTNALRAVFPFPLLEKEGKPVGVVCRLDMHMIEVMLLVDCAKMFILANAVAENLAV